MPSNSVWFDVLAVLLVVGLFLLTVAVLSCLRLLTEIRLSLLSSTQLLPDRAPWVPLGTRLPPLSASWPAPPPAMSYVVAMLSAHCPTCQSAHQQLSALPAPVIFCYQNDARPVWHSPADTVATVEDSSTLLSSLNIYQFPVVLVVREDIVVGVAHGAEAALRPVLDDLLGTADEDGLRLRPMPEHGPTALRARRSSG